MPLDNSIPETPKNKHVLELYRLKKLQAITGLGAFNLGTNQARYEAIRPALSKTDLLVRDWSRRCRVAI